MSGDAAFVGRVNELAAMLAELDRARSGQPRVLWLAGPAGIGKTTLIRRLLRDQAGLCVLWSGGEDETGLPFGVLDQLVGDVPPRLLGPLLAGGPAADADPLAVGAELLTVLGGLLAAAPVVVVVDDAQWVDDASTRALLFLVRRLRRDQVLIIGAVRDDVPDGSGAWARNPAPEHLLHRIALGGLGAEEIGQLSEAVGGPAMTPEASRRLRDHTGGHPLHATTLLTELPPDALTDISRILPAPRSFASLVLVRVAKLSPPAQDLVVAAAVLGPRSTLSDAVALAAGPDPLAALDESIRAGLLEEVLTGTGHHLAFPHELVRAAVYTDLPPARRHALHAAAAGLLGGSSGLDHRVAAAVGPDSALATELTAQALVSGPPSEVAALARFVRVLGLAMQGRHADAERELASRMTEPDPAAAGQAQALSGMLALWTDDAAGAAAALSSIGPNGTPPLSVQGRIMVAGHLAEAQYRIGDWDGAAANGALAVSLVRDAGVLLGRGVANALASHVAAGRGDWDLAEARVATATLAAQLLPWWGARAHAATAQAVLAQARGDHATMHEALSAYSDPAVHDPVDRIGVLPWRALRVEALLGLGRVDEAEAELTKLEQRLAGRPPGWSALEAARLRCEIAEARSATATARRAYRQAMELAERVPAELSRARLEIGHGRHLLAAGERRPAVDLLRAAHERLERLGAAPFLDRCDELLRAAGLRPPARGGALQLTPQELAVARLVAEGRTNQEAGAALFVTGRTVAFHLSNIYAKLGVSSRRELSAHLRDLS